MSLALAAFLRPLVFLLVAALVLIPVRLAIQRWMPEGRLKRILLLRVNAQETGERWRE